LYTGVDDVIVRKKSRDVKDRIQMVSGEHADGPIVEDWSWMRCWLPASVLILQLSVTLTKDNLERSFRKCYQSK